MPSGKVVRRLLCIGIRCIITIVSRDKLEPIEDFQGVGIIDYVHPLADELLRHAVVMLVQGHVTVAENGY